MTSCPSFASTFPVLRHSSEWRWYEPFFCHVPNLSLPTHAPPKEKHFRLLFSSGRQAQRAGKRCERSDCRPAFGFRVLIERSEINNSLLTEKICFSFWLYLFLRPSTTWNEKNVENTKNRRTWYTHGKTAKGSVRSRWEEKARNSWDRNVWKNCKVKEQKDTTRNNSSVAKSESSDGLRKTRNNFWTNSSFQTCRSSSKNGRLSKKNKVVKFSTLFATSITNSLIKQYCHRSAGFCEIRSKGSCDRNCHRCDKKWKQEQNLTGNLSVLPAIVSLNVPNGI